jgi:general secretion pathway protein A
MYLSFYQLKEEPFRLTPDPRFIHFAEPHRKAFLMLVEGVVRRGGFSVLSGAVGTGKTTLLHTLFLVLGRKFVGDRKISSAFIVNPMLSREEFLEYVLQELEINCSHTTKPRRLLALHQSLLETQRRGATTVLVIDEAHLLSPEVLEEIRLLNNVESYSEKLLQVILCGQPELEQTLAAPRLSAFNQRIAVRTKLRELSVSETRAYIAERLHVAGLRDASPFPPALVEQIHFCSEGVPRLINLICDSCLSLGFKTERKILGSDVVFEAAALLGLDPGSRTIARVVPQVGSPFIEDARQRQSPI